MKLIISVGFPLLIGFIGSFYTMPAIGGWYATLVQPSIAPLNWVFGPVWTLLYILMGIAAFLVWRRGLENKWVRIGLSLFLLQLILNLFWSIIFFRLENIGGALIEIVVLWVFIVATMIAFFKVSRLAAFLLVPYLLWVSFAAYLNYSFWILNV